MHDVLTRIRLIKTDYERTTGRTPNRITLGSELYGKINEYHEKNVSMPRIRHKQYEKQRLFGMEIEIDYFDPVACELGCMERVSLEGLL